jgi:transposase
MLNLDLVQDVETLRKIARLQEREIEKLHQHVAQLAQELARLKGQDGHERLQQELDLLKELLQRREQALFGDSSERRPHPSAPAPVLPTAPAPGHGPRQQPLLPRTEVTHVLEPAEQQCPVCGGALEEMKGQTEDAEEVTVIERQFVLVTHRRQKYRCRCNASVVTAPGPPKLRAGSRYSPEFAVEAAAAKWLDHIPLERQVRIMRREGLEIDSQTLWDQVNTLAYHLEPTYGALGERVLASPVIGADETWWRLMGSGKEKRWWVWAATGPDAVYYKIQDTRSTRGARALLGDYRGVVVVDGYGVYQSLSRAGPQSPGFRLANCWAHCRRKYAEIEANYPEPCGQILDLIGELYGVEQRLPRWDPLAPEDERAVVLAERRALRQEHSRPITERIRAWALAQHPLPRSDLGQAVRYMLELWPGLTVFLDDPRVPLDTNATERGLRGVVVGRKNHYGSRSHRGIQVAAIFYSLFESAKLCGVEPKSYVLAATHAAIRTPGAVTLPHTLLNSST